MTISEIIQRIRIEANDDGITKNRKDSYYTSLIISAINDLEAMMGKVAVREDSFQFLPVRGADNQIIYQEDGITPEIDPTTYHDSEDDLANSPVNIIVNKGLRVKDGAASGSIQTAVFVDDFGMKLAEPNIAFVRLEAETVGTVAFDISLDNRETWLKGDHGIDIEAGSYIDVSRVPSLYVALKWTLTGADALVRHTTFRRLYIPQEKLRKYGNDIIDLVKLRLLEIRIDKAISNGNIDPALISGMQYQALEIRKKYGLNKSGGDTRPMSSGGAVQYYPATREEAKVFGFDTAGQSGLLVQNRVVSLKSDGSIRRA